MSIKEKLAAAKASKKELTPKQQKVRTILNWVATAVCIIVILFALVVAIFTISSTTNDNHLMQFGDRIYMNVASDSMKPAFTANDILITYKFDRNRDMSKLQVGQVVTYKTIISSHYVFNTHRIVKVNYTDATNTVVSSVVTRGDNQSGSWQEVAAELAKDNPSKEVVDSCDATVSISAIIATWGSVKEDGTAVEGKMLKGCGAFSNWIQDTEHFGEDKGVRFFCVVVLPLILLFVVYAFVLIRTLVIAKLENQNKVQAEQVVTVDSLSDEEKRRLAQEYLASLANDSSDPTKVVQDVQEDSETVVVSESQSTVDDVQIMDESVDEQSSDDSGDNQ